MMLGPGVEPASMPSLRTNTLIEDNHNDDGLMGIAIHSTSSSLVTSTPSVSVPVATDHNVIMNGNEGMNIDAFISAVGANELGTGKNVAMVVLPDLQQNAEALVIPFSAIQQSPNGHEDDHDGDCVMGTDILAMSSSLATLTPSASDPIATDQDVIANGNGGMNIDAFISAVGANELGTGNNVVMVVLPDIQQNAEAPVIPLSAVQQSLNGREDDHDGDCVMGTDILTTSSSLATLTPSASDPIATDQDIITNGNGGMNIDAFISTVGINELGTGNNVAMVVRPDLPQTVEAPVIPLSTIQPSDNRPEHDHDGDCVMGSDILTTSSLTPSTPVAMDEDAIMPLLSGSPPLTASSPQNTHILCRSSCKPPSGLYPGEGTSVNHPIDLTTH
jgi:hypothetical protein